MQGSQKDRSSALELQRLKVLQTIAEHLNRTLELQPMLETTLPLVLKLMGLDTGWIMLRDEEGGFYTAATYGLPPALEAEDRVLLGMWPCRCQRMLLSGELQEGVNIVECERLQEWVGQRFQTEDPEALDRLTGGLRAHASVPLRSDEEMLGILNVAHRESEVLDNEALALLTLVGEYMGIAVDRARRYEQTTRHLREMKGLAELAQALIVAVDTDAVLNAALQRLVEITGVDGAECHLTDEENLLTLAAAWRLDETFVKGSKELRFPPGEGIPGLAYALRDPVYVRDAQSDPRYRRRELARAAGYRSLLCVPLLGRDSLLGTFILYSREFREFSEEEQTFLLTVGGQVALAIERARFYEQLKAQRVQEQDILLRLSGELVGLTDPQAVIDVTTRTVQEALQVDYVSVMVPDAAGQQLVLIGGVGWEAEMIGRYQVDVETSREGYVFRTGEPVQQPDVQRGDPFPCPGELRERGVVSSVTVLLQAKGRPLGTLCAHSTRRREFTPEEMRLLSLIANQAAIALERAREHQAVKEAEARYHGLFDGVPVGLYRSTPEGQLLDANPALVQLLGYPDRESLLKVNAVEVYVDPEERKRWYALIEQQGLVRGFEARFRRTDGTIIWIRDTARAVRDAEGRVRFIEGSVEDITAQKEAETALRWAEQRYRRLFEEAPVMYVITRAREGTPFIEDCNRAFLETLGYTREEVIGRPLGDFYTPASRRQLVGGGGYQRALRSEFLAEERQLVTRDGRIVETILHAVPETDPEGRVIGTRAMFVDVTARKEAERLLQRERDRLAVQSRILASTLRLANLDELLNLVLDEVLDFLDVEFGGVHLVQGHRVVLRAWRGVSDEFRASVLSFPADDPPKWMREPHTVHEYLGESGLTPDFAKREGIQAWAAIPLHLPPREGGQGEWLGALIVGSRRREALDETDIQALRSMGEQLALAIDHLRTFRQARERLARLQTLREIDRAIVQSLELEAVLRVVLERVPRELGADAVAISLLDESRERFQVFVMRLPNGTVVEEAAFDVADSLLHWFTERQEPVIIHDLALDPRVQMHRKHIRDSRLVSYLGVPLVVREQTIGILHILTVRPRIFADEDVEFFRTMAGQAAIAIDNARAFAETTQRAKAVESMLAAQVKIASAEPARMAPVILASLRKAVEAERAGFFRYNERTQTLTLEDAIGFPRERIDEIRPQLVFRLGEERGLVGLVALTRQPLYVPDCYTDPRWIPADPTIRSAYFIPLAFGERLFGVVNLLATEPHAFSAHQRALVDLFAHYAAAALESGRLLAETRRRAAHLEALNAVIAAAAAATDLPSLLETALSQTLRAVGLEMGAIWLRHAFPPLLLQRGLPAEIRDAITQILDDLGIELDAVEVRGPIHVDDWQQIEGGGALRQAIGSLMERFGIRASLIVPITAQGRRLGGLSVVSSEPHAWEAEEIALVEAVGQELGAAVERLRLFEEAQERAERMAHLAALSEMLNRPHTEAQVIQAIGYAALGLSGADRAAVYLRNPNGTVSCPWSQGLSPEYIVQVTTRAQELPGGSLAERTEPILLSDITELPTEAPVRQLAEAEGYRAVGLWPLIYEGRVIAAMGCYYDAPHTWSGIEQEVMQALARQAAVALESARLFEAEQARRRELAQLYGMSHHLVATDDLEAVMHTIVRQGVEIAHTTFCRLLTLEEDGSFLCRAAYQVRPLERELGVGQLDPEVTYPYYRRALAQTDPQVLRRDDPTLDTAVQRALFLDLAQSLGLAPLRVSDEAIGLLVFGEVRSESREPFSAEKLDRIAAMADQAASALHRARLHAELEDAYVQTVLALANAMDARDTYTADHSEQMAAWAEAMARALGCSEQQIQAIRWAALLHDIGKIAVPDEILRKPGELTAEEWEVIKRHPEIGAEIVAPVKKLADVAPLIRAHQERWDGTGYPDNLKGEEIPLGARILAVVDAYSAIIDERPYKPARSHEEAVEELKRCAGTQFDPRVVEAFLGILNAER